jgi:ABC-type uncharacterized transport system permease subunit
MPTASPGLAQAALVILAVVVLLAGGAISLTRIRWDKNALRLAAKSLQYVAITLVLAAVFWHGYQRNSWTPLEDNFQTLCGLGILLAGFWMYVQRARPIFGLDWFLMPIVVLLWICAVIFGTVRPSSYRADNLWSWTHLLSSFGGALAFAVAAGVGCMYLIVSARLRRKTAAPGPNLGSLERLEHVTDSAVTVGFALLTVGMITGLAIILQNGSHTQLGAHWFTSPKVILAFGVWVVYGLALHTPITPAVRGRKAAMLSIFGFILMFATLVAAQFMPGGR